MNKISNYFKIALAVILAVTCIYISPIRAAEEIEVNIDERVIIDFSESPITENITITKDMFDLSNTDWGYSIYYNNYYTKIGVIDESFESLTLGTDIAPYWILLQHLKLLNYRAYRKM